MEKRWRESAVNAKTLQNEQKRPKFARYGKRGEIIPLNLQCRTRAARGITERIEKMRVTKNPRLKHRAEVDMAVKLSDINVNHRCRLLYVLYMNSKYHFYRKKMQEFLAKCDEYAEYILENRDRELLEYRFEKLLKDTPYINQEKAELILDCQEGFATDAERPLYIEPNCRDDMIACILLAMIVLHYEYNFYEDRMNRLATEWAHCGISEPHKWVEKHLKTTLNYSDREYIEDWLDKSTPKKQRTTLQEQKQAKAGLEALRRYQQEVQNGKAQHI